MSMRKHSGGDLRLTLLDLIFEPLVNGNRGELAESLCDVQRRLPELEGRKPEPRKRTQALEIGMESVRGAVRK